MKKKQTAKRWPILIGLSIFAIFLASVATVMVALEHPVEMSDHSMQDYHHYDANANHFIHAKIEFNKRYDIAYVSENLDLNSAVVMYKVTDKDGRSIDNARINIVMTRPSDNHTDIILENPTVNDGVYTFEKVTLPKEGRWNIMAKVAVGDMQRYYNLKADTRYSNVFEY